MERTKQTDTTGRAKASKDVGMGGAEETSEDIKSFLVLLKNAIGDAVFPGNVCPKSTNPRPCECILGYIFGHSEECKELYTKFVNEICILCKLVKHNVQNIIELVITDSRLKENVEDLSFSLSPSIIFKQISHKVRTECSFENTLGVSFEARVFRIINKNNEQHLNISIIVWGNYHKSNNISFTVKDGPSLINSKKSEKMKIHIAILFNHPSI